MTSANKSQKGVKYVPKGVSKTAGWKKGQKGKCAIMIDGARRVDKSYIAQEFAKNEYESHILLQSATTLCFPR